jgi:hypothetical protein
MNAQLGLMFAETDVVSSNEQPAGTWTRPMMTSGELAARLAIARAVLEGMTGPVRAVMRLGLGAFETEWANLGDFTAEVSADHREFPEVQVMASAEEIAAWITHCENTTGVPGSSMHYEVRNRDEVRMAGQYVEDLGSLVLHCWAEGDEGVTETLCFMPWRDSLFIEHFRDEDRRIACPIATWAQAYAADKLSPGQGGRCAVPTFFYAGREYVNSGMMLKGTYAQCNGWSLCPVEDWRGSVYSYSRLGEAWDEGRLARGDLRGLVVWVKGQARVLVGVTVFYDLNVARPDLGSLEVSGEGEVDDPERDEF